MNVTSPVSAAAAGVAAYSLTTLEEPSCRCRASGSALHQRRCVGRRHPRIAAVRAVYAAHAR
jgi:hypothetical protein